MSETPKTPFTRDQLVWKEGRDAAKAEKTVKDNPYRSGSADARAWVKGFKGARDI